MQRPAPAEGVKEEEEEGSKLICVAVQDDFMLKQDICVMCGAIGTDLEGRLIACTQCGECYHPHCISVRVTKSILQRGWRCYDCIVCEKCGNKHDEANMVLCDECDISYHIYCMSPPLDSVPTGMWKCKFCAICHQCGSNDPGPKSRYVLSVDEIRKIYIFGKIVLRIKRQNFLMIIFSLFFFFVDGMIVFHFVDLATH